jgi:hypothetical protein
MRKYGLIAILLVVAIGTAFYLYRNLNNSTPPKVAHVSDPSQSVAATNLAQEFAQVRPGVTVAEWRRSHPSDDWYKPTFGVNPYQFFNGSCAEFARTEQLPGSALTRKAVFYLPEPPTPLTLPSQADASNLVEADCTLGVIQTELTSESANMLTGIAENARSLFSARFGAPSEAPDTERPVFGNRDTPVWKIGEAQVEVEKLIVPPPDAIGHSKSRLTAYSYLPSFYRERRDRPDDIYEPLSPEESPEIFQLAMDTAAMGSKISAPMSDIYHGWIQFRQRTEVVRQGQREGLKHPVETEEVASALRRWLQVSKDLPPQRRAAALLAAYFVLDISWHGLQFPDYDNEAQKQLEAAGAEFDRGGPDGIQPLAKWLKEARDLDPEGPIGDAVTLMSLSAGWHLAELVPEEYAPGKTKDITDYIIATGERFLSRPRDPALTARVEYFIASAYCDRVAVSKGSEGILRETPTQGQLDRGDAAKLEALKHYRSLLAIDGKSKRAVAAWRAGWRLMADLPTYAHYSEIND